MPWQVFHNPACVDIPANRPPPHGASPAHIASLVRAPLTLKRRGRTVFPRSRGKCPKGKGGLRDERNTLSFRRYPRHSGGSRNPQRKRHAANHQWAIPPSHSVRGARGDALVGVAQAPSVEMPASASTSPRSHRFAHSRPRTLKRRGRTVFPRSRGKCPKDKGGLRAKRNILSFRRKPESTAQNIPRRVNGQSLGFFIKEGGIASDALGVPRAAPGHPQGDAPTWWIVVRNGGKRISLPLRQGIRSGWR